MKKFFLTLCLSLLMSFASVAVAKPAYAFDPFGVDVDPTVSEACDQTNTDGNTSPVCDVDGTTNPFTGPDGIINTIANIIAFVAGVAAVVFIIIGGFEYVRSGGESAKINKAKNTILFAVIGLVVVVVARTLVLFVVSRL